MSLLLGYGLPDDIDEAMTEAVERCTEVQQTAIIINRVGLKKLAEIITTPDGYQAKKKE